jgi:membrane protein involved in colicin uptake
MTETANTTTTAPVTTTVETTTTPPDERRTVKIEEHAEERKRRQSAEALAAELKAKLDKITAEQMTDLEKAQKAAADALAAAERARVEALRYKIAAKHGIDDTDAELFLTGGDENTMAKQAQRLLERTPTTPRPDPSQGSPGDLALNGDPLLADLKQKLGIA